MNTSYLKVVHIVSFDSKVCPPSSNFTEGEHFDQFCVAQPAHEVPAFFLCFPLNADFRGPHVAQL